MITNLTNNPASPVMNYNKDRKAQVAPSLLTVSGIGEAPLDRNAANEKYLQENTEPLEQQGCQDAARSEFSRESFSAQLDLIKARYLNWCQCQREGFLDYNHRLIEVYKTLIQSCDDKLRSVGERIGELEAKAQALRAEQRNLAGRDYRKISLLKLFINVIVVIALGIWTCFYYGSNFFITQISATEMIDGSGEVIRLFSVSNMLQGWPLALFPLSAATLAGFLRRSKWVYLGEMLTFLAMDICLSLTVEKKIGEGFAYMDIPYAFDLCRFALILLYGFVASVFFCEASYMLRNTTLRNEFALNREAAKDADEKLDKTRKQLNAARLEWTELRETRLAAQDRLSLCSEKDVEWTDTFTLEGLYNSYLKGYTQHLSAYPDKQDIDKVVQSAREIIEQSLDQSPGGIVMQAS